MQKRIAMRKAKHDGWFVYVPGKGDKWFQLKSSAEEYKDANVRVKAKRKRRAKRSR